ncbi:MAG: translation initiation factor IF-2 N-terminal domain-containing protein, partial [Planctomycetaceae bacterium]|nr:translation initiation factor IF-2 N-terminal domain-containing protein [Planctomycetaceae bacterium]
MKIRIFALAKELGMDSKVLIDECNQAGVKLKNSALASITPAERDIVIAYLNQKDQPAASAAEPVDQATLVPQREPQKMRTIKAMTSRAQLSRSTTQKSAEETAEQEEGASGVAVEQEEAESETAEDASHAADERTGVATGPVESRGGLLRRKTGSQPEEEAEKTESESVLSRDDYVPAGGAMRTSSMREMKPRGST